MAELTKNIVITVKDGYNAKDVETLLLTVGARVNSLNGNTVNATVSPLLINHLKVNTMIENVSETDGIQTAAPIPAPEPVEDKKRWFTKE